MILLDRFQMLLSVPYPLLYIYSFFYIFYTMLENNPIIYIFYFVYADFTLFYIIYNVITEDLK